MPCTVWSRPLHRCGRVKRRNGLHRFQNHPVFIGTASAATFGNFQMPIRHQHPDHCPNCAPANADKPTKLI